MTELKLCPFCGSKEVIIAYYDIRVSCNKCGSIGPVSLFTTDAINAWNTRQELDDIPDWFRLELTARLNDIEECYETCKISYNEYQIIRLELEAILSLKKPEDKL